MLMAKGVPICLKNGLVSTQSGPTTARVQWPDARIGTSTWSAHSNPGPRTKGNRALDMRTHISLSKAEAVDAYWYPQNRRIEWLADVIVHAVGLALAIGGCILLV